MQSVTITPVTNTYLTNLSQNAKRSGNVVSIGGSAYITTTVPVNSEIEFAITSAPPSFNISVMCDRIDSSHIGARIACQTSGKLILKSTTSIPSGVYITFSGTYVCS